jgi:hypothetical protein
VAVDPFLFDGATLEINDGASSAYVEVTGVLTMTPPEEELGARDTTALDSTAGSRTKAPNSRSDPGTWQFTLWNSSTEKERLITLRANKTEKDYKVTWPNGDIDVIPSFINKVSSGEMGIEDQAKLTVSLTVTGAVTRTY